MRCGLVLALVVLVIPCVVSAATPPGICTRDDVRAALGTLIPANLPMSAVQTQKLQQVITALRGGRGQEAREAWAEFGNAYFTHANQGALSAAVRHVLREGLVAGTPGLSEAINALSAACQRSRKNADAVKVVTAARQEMQAKVGQLRGAPGTTTKIRPVEVRQTAGGMQVYRGRDQVMSLQAAEALLARLDEQVKTTEEQSQLVELDLQKVYQDYQPAIATIANIQKQLHDDGTKIISNLRS